MKNTKQMFGTLMLSLALGIQTQAAQVYYTDVANGTAAIIKRVNSDGSGMTNLVTGLQHPRGMALDVSGGKMYWTDSGFSAIRRANLDGTGVETVVPTGDASGAVALDLPARKLYWTTATGPTLANPRIGRANLDGSGQENLVTNGMVHPVGIVLDTLHGKVYWTDLEGNYNGTGSIRRCNLDGSNAETLLTGIDEANGIAVDASGGKIYWTEIATHRIQRANLDGSGVQDVVVGLNTPTTLSLDLVARKIYWTDSERSGQVNRIQKANLDGSNVELVVSGIGFPWGIALDTESANLVAYYPFNGNANDESGYGNNGTVNGATLTTDRFGVSGKAMSFNGASFIQAPHQSYLNFPSGDFTMSFWASLNDTNKYQFFMGKDMGQGNNPKWILMYGSSAPSPPLSLGFSFHITSPPSGSGWYAGSDTKLKSSVWQHVLVRKTLSQYDFFIDGAHVSTGTGLSTLPQNNTAPLTIGNAEGSGAMVNGKLDDIRIYTGALSDSEIQQLYAMESGPRLELIKAVKPSFRNLTITTNYQLQVSGDLNNWTNHGSPFTATNTSMIYPQYWDVENWGQLFFRVQVAP